MVQKICHRLVAETAKDIARAVYDVLAMNNDFYKAYPTMQSFVNNQWSYFIGDARRSLATMLKPKAGTENNPEFYYSQHIRDEIFEALLAEGEMKGPGELPVQPQTMQ